MDVKVADGVATSSKRYWCKGDGWLISILMVDISYTTLHKKIVKGVACHPISTPPRSAPDYSYVHMQGVTCILIMHLTYSIAPRIKRDELHE